MWYKLRKIQTKTINLPSDGKYRIKTVDKTKETIHFNLFTEVFDSEANDVSKNYRYRLKKVCKDNKESYYVQTKSNPLINLKRGLNKLRLRAVSKQGLPSDYYPFIVYSDKKGTEVIGDIDSFLFGILDVYFNDYLSEIFITDKLFDNFDFISLGDEVERVFYERFEDFVGLSVEDLTVALINDFISKTDLVNFKPYEVLGFWKDYLINDSSIGMFIEDLVNIFMDHFIYETINDFMSEQINAVTYGEENIQAALTEQYFKTFKEHISKAYADFKMSDVALFGAIDYIKHVMHLAEFEEIHCLNTQENLKSNIDPKSNHKDTANINFKEVVNSYNELVKLLIEIKKTDIHENYAFILQTMVEDLMLLGLSDLIPGIEIESRLFKKELIQPTESVNVVLHLEDGSTQVYLTERFIKPILDIYFSDVTLKLKDICKDITLFDIVLAMPYLGYEDNLAVLKSLKDIVAYLEDKKKKVSETYFLVKLISEYIDIELNKQKEFLEHKDTVKVEIVSPTFKDRLREKGRYDFSEFISHLAMLEKDYLALQKEFLFKETILFDLYDDDIEDVMYDIMGVAVMGQVPMGLSP